ncbi:hypothetical protein C3L33_02572, partial [Rhododendron williamsianum]
MGASLSNLTESNGYANGGPGPGLGDIPESCVACVFLYLTPPEICNLARLNRAFRGAASSDSVWEGKLPPNYRDLLDLVMMPPERYRNLSKKDIFALLSRPVPFDDGNKARIVFPIASGEVQNLSKEDIFALLSRPVPFDDGNKACIVGVDYRSRRIFLEFGVFKSVEYTDMIFFAWEILQELWLDRVTGRLCMSISAKGMAITGIEDRRYWNWLTTEESR